MSKRGTQGTCFHEADITARVAKLQRFASAGLCLSEAARRLDMTLPALSKWSRRYAAEAHAELKHNGAPGRPDLSRDQAVKRLRLGAQIEAAGVNPFALAQWLFNNAPDGSADALADYVDE